MSCLGNRSASTARHMRSHSMSTSVTRSIVPFLLIVKPERCFADWMSPARRTISTAVARKTGSGNRDPLDHRHFHAAALALAELHLIHEAADQKDPAAGGLEHVLG